MTKRRQYERGEFPHVELSCHLQHGISAPLVVLYALCMSEAPTSGDCSIVSGYMLLYLTIVLVNKAATGLWVRRW